MKLVKTFAIIFIITLVIASFQNCSQPRGSSLLGSNTAQTEEIDSATTNAPFAFDLAADTISYNSCVGVDLNNTGIHGLKIGVNEGFVDSLATGSVKGGLKLTTEFLQYIGKNFSPNYPSSTITPGQIQYVLQNSTANKDMFIQYAVRKRSDLSVVQDLIQPSASSAISLPRDGYVERAPLSLDPVISAITKNVQFSPDGVVLAEGTRIYNLYESNEPRAIEASFGFSNYYDETYPVGTSTGTEILGFGEAYSDRVRQKFNTGTNEKYLLTITYGNPQNATLAADSGLSNPQRKTETDKTKAYGRSYALKFDQASTKAGWRQNLLKGVVESNLADSSPVSATWSCENVVIMKQTQWNNSKVDEPACVPLISADLNSSTRAAQVKRLRRHYLESAWNIGLFYNKNATYDPLTRANQPLCLTPKSTECYLPTSNILADGTDMGVNYDTSTECYLYAASIMGVSYTGSPSLEAQRKLGRCAQYASICVRNN